MDLGAIFGRWKNAFLIVLLASILLAAASPACSVPLALLSLAFLPILLWILQPMPAVRAFLEPYEAASSTSCILALLFQRPPPSTL